MDGLIRKIIIGDNPKNGMAYYVGMLAGDGKVSAIVYDDEHMHRFKRKRYLVYLQESDGSNVLWKSIEEMPSIIEYDCNF
jgi:hypothetical protein